MPFFSTDTSAQHKDSLNDSEAGEHNLFHWSLWQETKVSAQDSTNRSHHQKSQPLGCCQNTRTFWNLQQTVGTCLRAMGPHSALPAVLSTCPVPAPWAPRVSCLCSLPLPPALLCGLAAGMGTIMETQKQYTSEPALQVLLPLEPGVNSHLPEEVTVSKPPSCFQSSAFPPGPICRALYHTLSPLPHPGWEREGLIAPGRPTLQLHPAGPHLQGS